jgi:NAD(P)-dependent dehydrogenase (short-subunit alcohol dehydrogenase family)
VGCCFAHAERTRGVSIPTPGWSRQLLHSSRQSDTRTWASRRVSKTSPTDTGAWSQGLRAELAGRQPAVGVTVVCPGRIRTGLLDYVGTRPDRPAEVQATLDAMRAHEDSGLAADDAGRLVRDAVQAGRFWVFPNGRPHLPLVQPVLEELLAGLEES